MRAEVLRRALLEALACGAEPAMPFHACCDVCARTDTEGCLDVDCLWPPHYDDCCGADGRVLPGTLFALRSGRVACAQCVVELGLRGKAAQYGVTLSMLALAGAPMASIAAFWRAGCGAQRGGACPFTGDAIDPGWGVCAPCHILAVGDVLPFRRCLACTSGAPVPVAKLPPHKARSVASMQALARAALSTADLSVVRQLSMPA